MTNNSTQRVHTSTKAVRSTCSVRIGMTSKI